MNAIYYNGPLVETHIGDMVNEIYRHRIYDPIIDAAKWGETPTLLVPDDLIVSGVGRTVVYSSDHRPPEWVPAPLTIVDAGANIGITTAYFAAHAKRVISLEPCDQHRECLTAMIAENGLRNVKVSPCALWTEVGVMTLHHAANPTAHSLIDWNTDSKSSEDVPTTTLTDLGVDTIDILKLDVEGAESEILSGSDFQAMAPRIRYVVGEWHSWTKYSQETIRRLLNEAGYRAAWLKLGDDKPSIFLAWREGEREPDYGQVTK